LQDTPSNTPRERIAKLSRALDRIVDRRIKVMEVCGTHTVSIFRQGLRSLLPASLELVSGPGCPVCVTDQAEIDAAVSLARMEGITVATYGDMIKVPGSGTSLLEERSRGMDVRVVTSADQALSLARNCRDRTVVLIAVGFETTAPATASVILDARSEGLENFLVLDLHKSVPPALKALASDPLVKLDAFLLPGHVSVITGLTPYRFLPEEHGIACAVAGFEAEEIMIGLLETARQVKTGRLAVASLYSRAVRPEGNPAARAVIEKVFTYADAPWRGLGIIPSSGYVIREEFAQFDALKRLDIPLSAVPPPEGCLCGEVLRGLIEPPSCPLFGCECTPNHPVGPCMVSTEGSCAAFLKFHQGGDNPWED
jgi:hydrogenase expression/formation protein HypD